LQKSDWKLFKSIKKIAFEKYYNLVLEASQTVISKQDESVHNKYLLLYKLLIIRSEGLADQALRSNYPMSSVRKQIRRERVINKLSFKIYNADFFMSV